MSIWSNRQVADETSAWSAPLGIWAGVSLRCHVTLAITTLVIGVWALETASFELGLGLAIYLASLILHESAHVLAASRVGGLAKEIVLGPFGGLRPAFMPADPKSRVFVAMAGPLTHLTVVVLSASYLALRNDPTLASLFVPNFNGLPTNLISTTNEPAVLLARLVVWINWPLFLLNLLPAFPFDGGSALRAWLAQWVGRATAIEITHRFAWTIGLGLILFSSIFSSSLGDFPSPSIAMASLGALVLFGARRDAQFAHQTRLLDLGKNSSSDAISDRLLDADDWLDGEEDQMVLVELRQLPHDQDPLAPSMWDETQVDAVLAKLHDKGLDRLTSEERSILEQASQHYRRRRDS